MIQSGIEINAPLVSSVLGCNTESPLRGTRSQHDQAVYSCAYNVSIPCIARRMHVETHKKMAYFQLNIACYMMLLPFKLAAVSAIE